jgi:hypothetical protein
VSLRGSEPIWKPKRLAEQRTSTTSRIIIACLA